MCVTPVAHFLFFRGNMIITFCGHSDHVGNAEEEKKIIAFLTEKIGDEPAELFLGGYGFFDDFACRCGKKYQKTHPNVKLVFVTPYITEDYQENHLERIKKLYDYTVYPEIEDKPLRFAIFYRNRWMVEKADYVVACVNHYWGGAYQTYRHAKRKKKPIFNIGSLE